MSSPPHTSFPAWPAELAAGRFAGAIRRDAPDGCAVALLGLPDDTGVRLNNGRPGAAEGPRAFREALSKYGVAGPHGWAWPRVFDAGDVVPAEGRDAAALEETHRRVTEAAGALVDLGLFPVAIGGGHDLTFPFVRAVAERSKPWRMAGVYFDAHLDVRETVGSGMPFRRLIEECGVRELHVHGLSPLANAREHVEWFKGHGGTVVGREDAAGTLRALPDGDLFASFDLDVIDAAFAPGVSAMNPDGWTVREAAAWVERLGRHPKLRCFDIMELSPPHDDRGRTARVAAHLFLSFLRGFVGRGG